MKYAGQRLAQKKTIAPSYHMTHWFQSAHVHHWLNTKQILKYVHIV